MRNQGLLDPSSHLQFSGHHSVLPFDGLLLSWQASTGAWSETNVFRSSKGAVVLLPLLPSIMAMAQYLAGTGDSLPVAGDYTCFGDPGSDSYTFQ